MLLSSRFKSNISDAKIIQLDAPINRVVGFVVTTVVSKEILNLQHESDSLSSTIRLQKWPFSVAELPALRRLYDELGRKGLPSYVGQLNSFSSPLSFVTATFHVVLRFCTRTKGRYNGYMLILQLMIIIIVLLWHAYHGQRPIATDGVAWSVSQQAISVGKKTVSPANGWTNRDVISTESWRSNMNFEVSWAKTRTILTLAQFEFKTLPGSVETL